MEDIKDETLTEQALKPGDILFTMSGGEAAHVSIYLGSDGNNKLTLARAVNSGNMKQLMKTSVPPDNYVVFRCKDQKLAELAAHIADSWASYNTPYDEQRLEIGTKVYNARTRNFRPEEQKAGSAPAYREDFDETGKYRLVKYAARRGASISVPQENGKGRGVWCGMFGLMCYQTAAVAKAGLVKPLVGDGQHRWVSDKYHDPVQTQKYFDSNAPKKTQLFKYAKYKKSANEATQNYNNYVEKTRGKDEFVGRQHIDAHKKVVKDHATHTPSLAAWDFAKQGDIRKFDFEPILSKGLMIEQKTADPGIFMHSLSEDSNMWENPFKNNANDTGIVKIVRNSANEQEKSEYKEQLKTFLHETANNSNKMTAYLDGRLEMSPTYNQAVEKEHEIINRLRV